MLGSLIALGAGVSFAFWTDLCDDLERSAPSMARRLGLLASVFIVTSMVLGAALLLSAERSAPGWRDWFLLVANGLGLPSCTCCFKGPCVSLVRS